MCSIGSPRWQSPPPRDRVRACSCWSTWLGPRLRCSFRMTPLPSFLPPLSMQPFNRLAPKPFLIYLSARSSPTRQALCCPFPILRILWSTARLFRRSFPWLRTFLLPSICSIFATYAVLRFVVRQDIAGKLEEDSAPASLSKQGRFAAWSIVATGVVLIGASAFGLDLGLPTCISAAIAVVAVTRAKSQSIREIAQGVSWSVLPLVAGLFVLVEAVSHAGALSDVGRVLRGCAATPHFGVFVASFGIAALSNLVNNLPSGLLAGAALQAFPVSAHIRDAVLIGVDLGPNLSVTGSLATVLWLIALRREGERMSGWQFLKVGFLVMPPALLLATLAVSLLSR